MFDPHLIRQNQKFHFAPGRFGGTPRPGLGQNDSFGAGMVGMVKT